MPWFFAGVFTAVSIALLAILTGLVGLASFVPATTLERSRMLSNRLFACFQFAVIWLAYEWLRSTLMTGFPILDAGYILVDTPFDGLAPILGVKGMSLAIAFVAASLVSGVASIVVSVFVVVGCVLLGLIDYVERDEPKQIGIVQINIPLTEKWERARSGDSFRWYSTLSQSMSAKDLVLWSEAAFATSGQRMVEALQIARSASNHAYIASGYVEFDDERRFNSLIAVGDDTSNYRKLRLVPFGEFVPAVLRPLLSFASVPHSDLFASDTDIRQLEITGLKLAPAICYEASFELDVRDAVLQSNADAIVVVSEDAWFGVSLAPHQNFEMARMRAREHGRYMIRAANSGISGIVGPRGEIVAEAPQFMRTTLEGEVFTMRGSTPYTRFGPTLLYSLLGLGLFSLVLVRVMAIRQAAK